MANEQVPAYAVFDDYRDTQRVAVWVRWFLIAVWLSLHNYRADIGPEFSIESDFVAMNLLVISVWGFRQSLAGSASSFSLVNPDSF